MKREWWIAAIGLGAGGLVLLCGLACAGFLILGSFGGAAAPAVAGPSTAGSSVVVNGQPLTAGELAVLARQYGLRIDPGSYWYDDFSGAWGVAGGATAGFLPAGLNLGGPLSSNASRGNTDVFVNGRELPAADLQAIERLVGPVAPASYWLDAFGNYGLAGGPMLGNLVVQAQSSGGTYLENTYGGYIGGNGDDSYFFDPETGCSVMPGGGVSC